MGMKNKENASESVSLSFTRWPGGHTVLVSDEIGRMSMKSRLFSGSAAALVTPMRESGHIDYHALENLIRYQLENQTAALVAAGTTGEASTLSDEEKRELTRFVIRCAGGRVPVIIGTGSNDTAHAVRLSKEAEELGADGLLVVTPYYNKASQEGLVRHYFAVADQTKIPVIVYNVPSRTGVNLQPETCWRLAGHPNICAIKDAAGNLSQTARTAALCGDDLAIYSGNDDLTIPVLSLGGCGVISVAANLIPAQMAGICRLYQEGKGKESLALFLKYQELMNAMFWDINPIPIKAALARAGLCGETCRLPLCEMDGEKKMCLYALMERLELDRKAGI